ncbi:MAG: GNAT family N-acetyltransferase, partial [Chitinophagaceae bacterium]
METIIIRKAAIADLAALQRIGRQTFSETFSAHNSEADMRQYLDTGFADAKLLAELEHPESAFYFAEAGGVVVGYLKLNWGAAQTEAQEPGALEIERIYVLREFHGKKA